MIAVVTFTDSRPTIFSIERENALVEKHSALIGELRKAGFEVLDVNRELGKYDVLKESGNFEIDSMDKVIRAGKLVAGSGAGGVIAGLWHWTESNLVTATVRKAKKLLLLYVNNVVMTAKSLYYARLSETLEENIKATTQGQCQGVSERALTYRTPKTTFTVARLVREGEEYFLLYFLATEEIESKLKTVMGNPLDKESLISAMGANHLSLVSDDYHEGAEFRGKAVEG